MNENPLYHFLMYYGRKNMFAKISKLMNETREIQTYREYCSELTR